MDVTVLLFAAYADVLGASRLTLQLSSRASVRDLLDRVRLLPGATSLPPTLVVAVNHEYASPQQELASGDEVALIPPVAGG